VVVNPCSQVLDSCTTHRFIKGGVRAMGEEVQDARPPGMDSTWCAWWSRSRGEGDSSTVVVDLGLPPPTVAGQVALVHLMLDACTTASRGIDWVTLRLGSCPARLVIIHSTSMVIVHSTSMLARQSSPSMCSLSIARRSLAG